jgi:low affinity Fe/Cu permease
MVGKWILVFGMVLVLVGAVVWLVESLGFPFGHLPGDIHLAGDRWSVYFPVATSIIISIVLTVLLNAFFWFFQR